MVFFQLRVQMQGKSHTGGLQGVSLARRPVTAPGTLAGPRAHAVSSIRGASPPGIRVTQEAAGHHPEETGHTTGWRARLTPVLSSWRPTRSPS